MNRFVIALLSGVAGLALVSGAQAADLIIDEPAAGVVEVASGNWDGLYVGGFVGGLWGTFDVDGGPQEWDANGWLVGLNVGANFTVADGIVAGVVGDVAWTDANNGDDPLEIDWTGSLRGRLGFDGGAFLPYLTAGLAVAGATIDTDSQTLVGWTVGAGIEFAVAENISLDLAYRYSDYGTATFDDGEFGLTAHAATVGVNFKF